MQKLLKQNQKNLTAFDQTKITNITDEYENYNKNKDDADVNIKEKRQDMQEALETAVQTQSYLNYYCYYFNSHLSFVCHEDHDQTSVLSYNNNLVVARYWCCCY